MAVTVLWMSAEEKVLIPVKVNLRRGVEPTGRSNTRSLSGESMGLNERSGDLRG
jgi:hypothetical protein